MFGPRSERSQRLLDQMELQLEELATAAGEDEAKAETPGIEVRSFMRRKATRRDFPEHLPHRRVVHPAPTSCPCCGSTKLSKIGEDITETLDVVPRQWFVTEHVREKFSCRHCEKITQPPAPFHVIARGFAGPSLLAMILVDKYANHQPLNRQSEQYAREGIELSVSTMADHVGACTAALLPLYELIKAHVFAAERIHGDDTTVPVLAKVKTRTGRIWTYVRDDRPFGGADPPAAVFFYSPDRAGIHPERHLAGYSGILQADAYAGFNTVYRPDRKPGVITEAGCWAHARRKLFELADIVSKARKGKPTTISPIAFEAVRKMDAILMLERSINGLSPEERLAARRRCRWSTISSIVGLRYTLISRRRVSNAIVCDFKKRMSSIRRSSLSSTTLLGMFTVIDATFVCLSVRMADGLQQIFVWREIQKQIYLSIITLK
jgi:transposase